MSKILYDKKDLLLEYFGDGYASVGRYVYGYKTKDNKAYIDNYDFTNSHDKSIPYWSHIERAYLKYGYSANLPSNGILNMLCDDGGHDTDDYSYGYRWSEGIIIGGSFEEEDYDDNVTTDLKNADCLLDFYFYIPKRETMLKFLDDSSYYGMLNYFDENYGTKRSESLNGKNISLQDLNGECQLFLFGYLDGSYNSLYINNASYLVTFTKIDGEMYLACYGFKETYESFDDVKNDRKLFKLDDYVKYGKWNHIELAYIPHSTLDKNSYTLKINDKLVATDFNGVHLAPHINDYYDDLEKETGEFDAIDSTLELNEDLIEKVKQNYTSYAQNTVSNMPIFGLSVLDIEATWGDTYGEYKSQSLATTQFTICPFAYYRVRLKDSVVEDYDQDTFKIKDLKLYSLNAYELERTEPILESQYKRDYVTYKIDFNSLYTFDTSNLGITWGDDCFDYSGTHYGSIRLKPYETQIANNISYSLQDLNGIENYSTPFVMPYVGCGIDYPFKFVFSLKDQRDIEHWRLEFDYYSIKKDDKYMLYIANDLWGGYAIGVGAGTLSCENLESNLQCFIKIPPLSNHTIDYRDSFTVFNKLNHIVVEVDNVQKILTLRFNDEHEEVLNLDDVISPKYVYVVSHQQYNGYYGCSSDYFLKNIKIYEM